jgi:acyl-CoA thioester hydrolase
MQIRVYYEDTDTGGVVYHSNYLNFCERARSDAFFTRGLSPVLESSHFVASKLEASYITSARLGDTLDIKTSLIKLKAASFELLQEVFLYDKKIFEMKITLAHIGFNSKPKKIDNEVKKLILELFN